MQMLIDLLFVIGISIFSFFAILLGALTKGGGLTASLVGIAIYFGIGAKGLVLLGCFFLSSTLWSRFRAMEKEPAQSLAEKGDRRDTFQVLANGGIASICAIMYGVTKESLWIVAFSISLASSNADTWASEIGVLSKRPPLLLSTLKRVEPGTSGAVSLLGTVSGFFGALFIAISAYMLWWNSFSWKEMIFISLAGFLGMLIDTWLGSFWQKKTKCLVCGKITEQTVHCGKKAAKISGFTYVNNDGVNLLSNIFATIFGIVAYLFLR